MFEVVLDQTEFMAKDYLCEYFHEINEENEGLYRFWVDGIQRAGDGLALELGVGPALYGTIPLCKKFKEIYLSDPVVESMDEIKRWVNHSPDRFDWSRHVELVLRTETDSYVDSEVVTSREEVLKKSIKGFSPCDLLNDDSLGLKNIPLEGYAIVTAHYCTEAVCSTNEEWAKVIQRISGLLDNKGMLLLSVSTGLRRWKTHSDQPQIISGPVLYRDDVKHILKRAGYDMDTLQMNYLPAPKGYDRPYDGTWLVSAFKT